MVSIIVPVYNVEKYIKLCLESIAKQSYLDYEVIIINDGSTDQSLIVVNNFIENHSEMSITIINIENQGVSAARNYGISKARGEFICFVDSDDMLDSEYLAILVEEILKYKADIAICRSKKIKEESTDIKHCIQPYCANQLSNVDMLKILLHSKMSVGIWALLCRRETLGSLKFAQGYQYSEDLEMVWRLIVSSKIIVQVNAQLYDYRIRSGSAMTKVDDRRVEGMKLFIGLEKYIMEKCPEFALIYSKYGVARWVWSTLWQEALAAISFKDFNARIKKYSPMKYMSMLLDFDDKKVRMIAFLFVRTRYIYYIIIKIIKKNYRRIG